MNTASNLAADLARHSARSQERMPSKVVELMQRKAFELEKLDFPKRALQLDATAPDFELPNYDGKVVCLSRLLEEELVILSFYRGAWCPYCNLEIKALQEYQELFKAAGARLLAITPQKPDFSLEQVREKTLSFEVLTDENNSVARSYGLVFTLDSELRPLYESAGFDIPGHNGNDSFELPIPATFLIDRKGVIRYRFVDSDYRKRAEPQEILEACRHLST